MRLRPIVVLVLGGVLLGALPISAHHAFAAEFDANKPIKVSGPISKVEWINPHAWIHIDVTGSDGRVITWMIEGGSPNTLLRRGLTRNTLTNGTVIVVDGYQAKDGSTKANGRDITFADGRKLFLGSSDPGTK